MKTKKRYDAYTILEMLIVMMIFVILSVLGVGAFSSMNVTIRLNEDIITLQQDIRLAQRSSMFLERGSNERWLYGIGIDFSTVTTNGKYRLFKWCSPFQDYGSALTTAPLPSYDTSFNLGGVNGQLPTIGTYYNMNCSKTGSTSEIVRMSDLIDPSISENLTVSLSGSDVVGDVGGQPVYVLFESVSGRAFFYDRDGSIVNYKADGSMVTSPTDFKLDISSSKLHPGGVGGRTISIGNISGRINVVTN